MRTWCYLHCHNVTHVTRKNYGFSILVFQDNTSKDQDFYMTFSAPTSNFRIFQDQWEPCIVSNTRKLLADIPSAVDLQLCKDPNCNIWNWKLAHQLLLPWEVCSPFGTSKPSYFWISSPYWMLGKTCTGAFYNNNHKSNTVTAKETSVIILLSELYKNTGREVDHFNFIWYDMTHWFLRWQCWCCRALCELCSKCCIWKVDH